MQKEFTICFSEDEIKDLKNTTAKASENWSSEIEMRDAMFLANISKLENKIKELTSIIQECVFNCPGCGRHDYGLLAEAGAICKSKHQGYLLRAEKAEAILNRIKKAIDETS